MEARRNEPSLAALPAEILVSIGEHLQQIRHVHSLVLTSRRLSRIFLKQLHELDIKHNSVYGGALGWGVCHDRLDVVKGALAAGADIDAIFLTRRSTGSALEGCAYCEGPESYLHWYSRHHAPKSEWYHPFHTPRLTPLLAAILHGHVAVAEHLIRVGADVNLHGPGGRRPIYVAIQRQNLTVVKLLMESGRLKLRVPDDDGETIAGRAASHRSSVLVQYILTKLKEDGVQEVSDVADAMNRAIAACDHELVAMLLRYTRTEASRDVARGRGIDSACGVGDARMVEILLKDKPLRTKLTEERYTHLMNVAARGEHSNVVKVLRERKEKSFPAPPLLRRCKLFLSKKIKRKD
ncbi:hypothetical protein NLG97_g3997 [Lecanicillium saksenae]|uniref:Uncharacterized protein n=1 Tax=Lecanicillium saksenae TaxID=468837 RepID=A0ACC1QWI4_9HYPO|nr:hypothetical protein NLG97_g3997 [Lecanicillium saksenae]